MADHEKLKYIVEAALLAAGGPLSLDALMDLFPEEERPDKRILRAVITELESDYQGRGIEVMEVGGGFRVNVREAYSPWVSRLWEERPPRYSRALMETLALIAYRQPITRGEIEEIRGVSVSSSIVKTLMEREWVRVVGHRDVPGKPSLFATTREFLNYFGLKGLGDLPTLQEIRDLDSINRELELEAGDEGLPSEPGPEGLEVRIAGAPEAEEAPEQANEGDEPEQPGDPGAPGQADGPERSERAEEPGETEPSAQPPAPGGVSHDDR